MEQVQTGTASGHAPFYALTGTIVPTRLPGAYRAGLVVVAAAMLLLPVIYVGIIGLAGMAVWWHLTANTWLLSGSSMQLRVIAYAGPAVVGGVVVFFMVKPLLARPARGRDPLPVTADEEPVLFAFIQQICQLVGAAVPRRVQVDCAVNASAGLLRGVLRRDLVLTIGLPLVAGLSVRQLGGVLAHEFGHFAQGGGMRVTAIVRGTNAWFARVVYERDEWDETLEQWSRKSFWWVSIVLGVARAAVWLSRRVLTGLMWTGHAISCFMMRQMEYDADRWEAKLAGSNAFAQTSARLRELGVASQLAYLDLDEGVQAGRIPSNLPAYVATRAQRIPARVLGRLREAADSKTGLFDTHPSDADRVRAAEAAAEPGILAGGDGPATQLFVAFDDLSAAATRHHYEHELGLNPGALSLVSVDTASLQAERREEGRRAFETLIGACGSVLRPLWAGQLSPADAADPLMAAAAAREQMQALGTEQLASAYRRFETLEGQRRDACAAEMLLDAGFPKIDAAGFGLMTGTREEAARAGAAARAEQQTLAGMLMPYEAAAVRRLSCGLALWVHARDSAPGAAGDGTQAETQQIEAALRALADVAPACAEIECLSYAGAIVQANLPASPNPAATEMCLSDIGRHIREHVMRVHGTLGAVTLPAGLDAGTGTLAAHCGLAPRMPPEHAAASVDRVRRLTVSLLGHVAALALAGERAATASA